MIEITHNLKPSSFVWLWAKYVTGFNPKHHCTNSLRGQYSKKFSKHNEQLAASESIVMDELHADSYQALYICGVARQGYAKKKNYEHNLHVAICPRPDSLETWSFENWRLQVRGGTFLYMPATEQELPAKHLHLTPEYTTCRIFRWAACYFEDLKDGAVL